MPAGGGSQVSKRSVIKNRTQTVYDASDEAQIRAAMDTEKDRALDLSYVLREPRGRRWVYEMIFNTCHMHRLSFVPGDSHATAFNEGARSVGEALLDEIRTNHFGAFMQMLEENHDPVD